MMRSWLTGVLLSAGILLLMLYGAAPLFLPNSSPIFSLPLFAAVLAALLPASLKFMKIVPAATATILFTPNIVLAFIATGLKTLALVALLLVMNAELWTDVYSRGAG